MIKNILCLILILLFIGCSKSHNLIQDKKQFTSERYFPEISRNALLEAIKKTFIFTSSEFEIDTYRRNLVIRKTFVNGFVFELKEHTWFIEIKPDKKGSKVFIYEQEVINLEEPGIYKSKEFHDIIFSRVEYFLSLNNSWEECSNFLREKNWFCSGTHNPMAKKPNINDKVKNTKIANKQSENLVDINDDILIKDNFLISKYKEDIITDEPLPKDIIEEKEYKEIDNILKDIKLYQNSQ